MLGSGRFETSTVGLIHFQVVAAAVHQENGRGLTPLSLAIDGQDADPQEEQHRMNSLFH